MDPSIHPRSFMPALPALPATMIALLQPFGPLFDPRTWHQAQVLRMGALRAPGRRTVSSALPGLGLQGESRAAVRCITRCAAVPTGRRCA